MCRIFAGTDPSAYQHVTRSVRIMGRATSIMLEAKFWEIVDDIASRQEMSTPQFLSTLHEEALELRGQVPNFASLLRVCCVHYLERPGEVPAAAAVERAPV